MDDVDFKLLANAETRSYLAGQTIFGEGDPGDEMFVIQGGSVRILAGGRTVETLSEHAIFGEMALVDDAPRSATAVAASDVQVVPVDQKQFLFLVRETPFFALKVMRAFARRLRQETGKLTQQQAIIA